MKIVKLQAENIKRIVAVEIKPDGALVELTGANGAGKSSVLDAIWWALAGTGKVQSTPIRQGEEQAHITLDLGEIVVTRQFKQLYDSKEKGAKPAGHTTLLRVETADGARYASPQAVLDKLLGALSFDPLEFARMKPPQQHRALAKVCGIDVAEIERENRDDYSTRRELNREEKAQRAAADQIEVPPDTPTEPVIIADLLGLRRDAEEHNRGINERTSRAADRARLAEESELEATQVAEQIAELDERRSMLLVRKKQLMKNAAGARKEASEIREGLPEHQDTDEIDQRLLDAQATNAYVEAARKRAEHVELAEQARKKAEALTLKMEARRADQATKVAAAELPVEGLELDDDVVTLNGLPFDVASDALQLRVSCALAMRQNSKLKVIRVRQGSLLDENGLALLQEMAEENGYQVWLERVDTSGKVGVYIEDGSVAAVDGEPPAPAADETNEAALPKGDLPF